MPMKPKHPCAYNGCPELTDGKYCDKHKNIKQEENHRYYTQERDVVSQAFYNSPEWLNLKNNYLIEHPLCERCRLAGKKRYAEVVHHRVPIREGGRLLDPRNLEAVCRTCHNQIHAAERFKRKVYTY